MELCRRARRDNNKLNGQVALYTNVPGKKTGIVLQELDSYSDWGVKPDDIPMGMKVIFLL